MPQGVSFFCFCIPDSGADLRQFVRVFQKQGVFVMAEKTGSGELSRDGVLLPENLSANGSLRSRGAVFASSPETDLFVPAAVPRVYSVSEIAAEVREKVEVIRNVRVRGEISEWSFRKNLFFSLRDQNSVIRCCMFRVRGIPAPEQNRTGKMAEVSGRFSYYAPSGSLSFIADSITITDREGMIMQALREGIRYLEDNGYTRNLLPLPPPSRISTIGIVTAQGKQAVRDAVGTIKKRNPLVNIVLYYCSVQGDAAPDEIMTAIYLANMRSFRDHCDALLVVRGGGSLEDLACFNDLRLCLYATQTRIPIVTGIGHSANDTLLDHVASLKAITPTAAAEAVTTDLRDAELYLNAYRQRYEAFMLKHLSGLRSHLGHLGSRMNNVSPLVFAREQHRNLAHLEQCLLWSWGERQTFRKQALLDLRSRLDIVRSSIRNSENSLRDLELRISRIIPDMQSRNAGMAELSRRMETAAEDMLRVYSGKLQDLERRLIRNSPRNCLRDQSEILQELKNRMLAAMKDRIAVSRGRLHDARLSFSGIRPDLSGLRHRLELLLNRMRENARAGILGSRRSFEVLAGRLNARNPLTLLSQGYAIVSRASGGIVSADNTGKGDTVKIRVLGALFTADITGREPRDDERTAGGGEKESLSVPENR